MGEADDENFVTFGSALEPLDEENLPRKKPVTIEEQYALDPQGRRRFHGAFTGGFSAGYFNSVGTRDGWRPQQFKSSRKSKAGGVSQRPEDFMDEEDTSEFGIAPTGIRANSDFTDHGRRGTKRQRQREDSDGPIPGVPVLKELLKPVKDTVGVTLLKKMGWRAGQGIGPRVTKREKATTKKKNDRMKMYGCALPNQQENIEDADSEASEDNTDEILFAPDDYELFICNPKDNYFGIGYTGLDRRPVLSGHVNLFEVPTPFKLQEKNKKLSIRGQAFGVGAFEADDEDIYQRDDMSRYDFSLGPKKNDEKSRWSRKKNEAEASKENCLDGFVPATKKLERKKMFEPPELPQDFKPCHVVRKSRFYPPIERPVGLDNVDKKGLSRPDLTAKDRARILAEPTVLQSRVENLTQPIEGVIGSKSVSAASNIITRTLNLQGREQTEERRLQDTKNKSGSASWLEKLSSKSFVSGGVEGSDPCAAGSLKKLDDFKTEIAGSQIPKPFVWNPEKQTRFEKFVELTKKGETKKLDSLQPLSMTEWERERERDEFEQATRIFHTEKPPEEEVSASRQLNISSDSTMRGKFVGSGVEAAAPSEAKTLDEQMKNAAKMKLYGKLTRERTIWQPASIVCKRFNIPEPRTGCSTVEKPTKSKRYSVFDSLDFLGVNDKFEGATDTAGTFKEPHLPYVAAENTTNDTATSTSRIFDGSDIDVSSSKSTMKMRTFEATYENVFGRGGPATDTKNAMENVNDTNLKELQENSIKEKGKTTNLPALKDNSVEKKDLFKAIFLSSSEESESDNGDQEDDSETIKSLLIGKLPGQLNLQRNTSPPRGIFAKLDLDSLMTPGNIEGTKKDGKSMLESGNAVDHKNNETGVSKDNVENDNCKVSSITEERPSMMYGPALPTKITTGNSVPDEASSSKNFEFPRPIFKSVVVTKNDGCINDRVKGKWVERDRSKKSKKTKHKHKHKEKDRSRHKHKSKKDKRG